MKTHILLALAFVFGFVGGPAWGDTDAHLSVQRTEMADLDGDGAQAGIRRRRGNKR